MLLVSLFGATLAGYVPLSALMPSLAPRHKGQAMSALNLGAGASTFLGPAVVGLFLGPLGVQGVMWAFAVLYLASALMSAFLTLPRPEPDTASSSPTPMTSTRTCSTSSAPPHAEPLSP
ncbi:MFS transporter [Streptomyces sp. MK37H]|uniref:MFS transporter n=1 Tax=Streptomyces sp. MK37H TaxID=2699117 RepID=UPI001FF7F4F7|nr:MFS transporter [Streptomyces sp. MK37H]